MNSKISVLDHGYVQLIESWGSDERIIESARMSTGKGFQGWGPKCKNCGLKFEEDEPPHFDPYCTDTTSHEIVAGDERLLSYLYTHKHLTPFEMCGLTLEIQAPIFVFREWHRHRTQSYNELSARYTPLPHLNYIPTVQRVYDSDSRNKQSIGVNQLKLEDSEKVVDWLAELVRVYEYCQIVYEHGMELGIPKEIARLPVPVARYSRMRASANLRNWLAFLTLRMDNAAQWEIRQYVNTVGNIISQLFPRTWELFMGEK